MFNVFFIFEFYTQIQFELEIFINKADIPMSKIINKPIVMIDFETTGLNPANGDRVTEVAALRIVDGDVVDRFVSLINCNVYIPSFITQLTGITQKMVSGAPPAKEVIPELLQFIGTDTLSAHRASFDEKF